MRPLFSIILVCITIAFQGCSGDDVKKPDVSVKPDPVLTNFTPLTGGKGTAITIIGQNFGTTPARVTLKINGLTCKITEVSDTKITAEIAAKSGLGLLELTVDGKTIQSNDKFRYIYSATTTYVTGGEQGFADGAAKGVKFQAIFNIIYDKGFFYVADEGNCLIRKIADDGTTFTLAGRPNSSGFQDGKGDQALMKFPIGVEMGPDGIVYVADAYNSAIRKITPDGTLTTLAGSPEREGYLDGDLSVAQFKKPYGVKFDKNGVLWVCDTENGLIRQISKDGKVSTYAGSTIGHADGKLREAKFKMPAHLTFDDSGNVYVADKHNNCIRKITPDGMVSTIAGKPGIYDYADGTGMEAMFNQPSSVQVDKQGMIYVTDLYNQCIRLIYPDGLVTTLAGTPKTIGYAEGKGIEALFWYPQGGFLDKDFNLYVTDSYNQRIRKLTIE